jgi:pectin methylesterase-like acyl-CoA thioesterase
MNDETPRFDIYGDVTFPGRIGTIFKSGNAVYLGRSAKSDEYLFAGKAVLPNRIFSELLNNESGWNYTAQKFESYGASKFPATATERREWKFCWRKRLTRRQQNSG